MGSEQAHALITSEAATGLRLSQGAELPDWLQTLPSGAVSPNVSSSSARSSTVRAIGPR